MSALEHRVPPPVWFLIFAAIMAALAYVSEPLGMAPWARAGGGLIFAALGGFVAVSGALEFRRAGANLSPTDIARGEVLVTSGIFRRTRNPMYFGLTLALTGFAIYLARPIELVPLVAFPLLLTRLQIQPEERVMQSKFGEAYVAYTRSTRRWI